MNQQDRNASPRVEKGFDDRASLFRQAKTYGVPFVLCSWLMIFWFATVRYSPPAAVMSTETEGFSAARAHRILTQLVGDGVAHPAGSAANEKIGSLIVEKLEMIGYRVQTQTSTQSIRFSRLDDEPHQVEVRNIIATLPGDGQSKAVALTAHYDSVPYGPGAADDAAAVAAILEIAQLAKTQLPDGRPIVLLITDGEEYGLLGARAFEQHEMADEIEFVVNLEGRGTSGPSLMFQTSHDSLKMIRQFASAIERPVTSSVFEEVYKRLPRDTDFTIWRDQLDYRGYNFAFIRNGKLNHTAEDSLENCDINSLQHHGDNAWSLLQRLHRLKEDQSADSAATGNRKSAAEPASAVYFDVYAFFVCWWPASINPVVCSIVVAAWLVVVWVSAPLQRIGAKTWIIESFWLLVSMFLAGAAGFGLYQCLAIEDRIGIGWVDYPGPMLVSFWSLILSVPALFYSIKQRHNEHCVWTMASAIWALLSIVTTLAVPGASYLFLLPLTAAVLLRGLGSWLAVNQRITNGLAAMFAAFCWLPLSILFYDAVGLSIAAVIVGQVLLLATTLAPVLSSNEQKINLGNGIGMLAIAIISTTAAVLLNPPH